MARFVAGRWKYAEVLWSGLRFESHCQLVFGLARDPLGVSEDIGDVLIDGFTLLVRGVPFAVFDRARDMWRGIGTESWWHAFRIESVQPQRPAMVSRTLERLQSVIRPPSANAAARRAPIR